mmetsp:Transcript_55204/g.66464  ORF Transcript_55204/g.66464 Transcript_55204/m.66464 type:complete len:213 (+) Transcript_55204:244-882(+)
MIGFFSHIFVPAHSFGSSSFSAKRFWNGVKRGILFIRDHAFAHVCFFSLADARLEARRIFFSLFISATLLSIALGNTCFTPLCVMTFFACRSFLSFLNCSMSSTIFNALGCAEAFMLSIVSVGVLRVIGTGLSSSSSSERLARFRDCFEDLGVGGASVTSSASDKELNAFAKKLVFSATSVALFLSVEGILLLFSVSLPTLLSSVEGMFVVL